MALSVKHAFQSAKPDGADATIIRPSNWNDEHALTAATDTLLGRASAGMGPVEEIPCTAFMRTVLDDTNAFNARTTLGAASQGSNTFTNIQTISAANAFFTASCTDPANSPKFLLSRGGFGRWAFTTNVEAAGTDLQILNLGDGGSLPATPALQINRATGVTDFAVTPTVAGVPIGGGTAFNGGTITTNLNIDGAIPALSLNSTGTNTDGHIEFTRANSKRFDISCLGADSTAGNLNFNRWDNTGATQTKAMDINRLTGRVRVYDPTAATSSALGAFVINGGMSAFGTCYFAAQADFAVTPTVAGTALAKAATISTSAPSGGVDGDVWYVVA